MELTQYFRNPDGSCSLRTVSGEWLEEPALPDGAVELSAQEHADLLEAMTLERAQGRAEAAAAHTAVLASDYAALLAAGIPRATATRLTGHDPDAIDPLLESGGLPVSAGALREPR